MQPPESHRPSRFSLTPRIHTKKHDPLVAPHSIPSVSTSNPSAGKKKKTSTNSTNPPRNSPRHFPKSSAGSPRYSYPTRDNVAPDRSGSPTRYDTPTSSPPRHNKTRKTTTTIYHTSTSRSRPHSKSRNHPRLPRHTRNIPPAPSSPFQYL